MGEPLTCSRCGATFTPPPELLERFPGWTPRECPDCFRARKQGSSAGGSRSGRPTVEGQRTLAEVLETHTAGPDAGLFTDGSASPNPGPGGWGAVYVVDGQMVAEAHGHEPHTTNNRMELLAILEGIELVPDGTPCTVYTDSNLVVRTVNEWAAGWERRGWRRKSGPVENLDLVRPLYEAVRARPELELTWIKAHAGYLWNEYADALANAWNRDTV